MAVKTQGEVTIMDLSDGYSIGMSSEGYNFLGDTQYALAGSCTTQINCYHGSEMVPVKIGTCTAPAGITVTVSNNETAAPTITISVAAGKVSGSCEVSIPITVGDDIQFTKKFSVGVALKGSTGAKGDKGDQGIQGETGPQGPTGVGVSKTETYYLLNNDSTSPQFSKSTFKTSATPPVTTASSKYLWACIVITRTDGTETNTGVYLASKYVTNGQNGQNGTSVKVSTILYAISDSATAKPTFSSTATTPIATTADKPYLWVEVTYSDGSKAYSVSAKGDTGSPTPSMMITSSAGTVFRNGSISTTLTAHVFLVDKELSDKTNPTLASLGTIKWYKDGGTTPVHTGQNYTITGDNVDSKAVFTAQLEG